MQIYCIHHGDNGGSVNPVKHFNTRDQINPKVRHSQSYKKKSHVIGCLHLWAFHKSRLETDNLLLAQILRGLHIALFFDQLGSGGDGPTIG